jgi:small subunit ribosomal protein S21
VVTHRSHKPTRCGSIPTPATSFIKKRKESFNLRKNAKFGLKVDCSDMPFEKALRIFRKKVDNSGLLKEVKERQQFVKPCIERKLAHSRAVKRWHKRLRMNRIQRNIPR